MVCGAILSEWLKHLPQKQKGFFNSCQIDMNSQFQTHWQRNARSYKSIVPDYAAMQLLYVNDLGGGD